MSLLVGEALSFFGALSDSVAGTQPEQTERVRAMCACIGRRSDLGMPDLRALDAAAVLRNAGIFRCTDTEDLPACGARVCERLSGLPAGTSDIVRWQLECWDGTGYPDRLRGGEIPRASRILRLAICYAACANAQEAHAAVTAASGRIVAPEVCAAFVTWYHSGESIAEVQQAVALDVTSLDAGALFAVLRGELEACSRTRNEAHDVASIHVFTQEARIAGADASMIEAAATLYRIRRRAVPLLDRFPTLRPVSRLLNTLADA